MRSTKGCRLSTIFQIRSFLPTILASFFIFSFYSNLTVQASYKSSVELSASPQTGLREFYSNLHAIVNQSQTLTKTCQDEIGKWRFNQYDNATMIRITNLFIPKFENITNSARNMTYPNNFKYIHDALVNSLNELFGIGK
jgi:hypothetical protein